jgi:hypothetical protein
VNRKQRRAAAKKKSHPDISDQLMMFDNLPDECLACTKPFDKKDKQMALTWSVVVRDDKAVRLYCPDCWGMATTVVEQFKKEKEDERQ